jgi:hypothetical protein
VNKPDESVSKEDFQRATAAIRTAIAEGEGPLPPHFVVEFLLGGWRRYMALVRQQAGESSSQWRDALEVTCGLVRSLHPPRDADQRAALIRALPRLIAELKAGASLAGMAADGRDAFLTALRDFHLQLLERANAPGGRDPRDALSDTITMDTRDPRLRALLDRLDGADGVEHIDM